MLDPTSNLGRLKRHITQIKQFEKALRKLLPASQAIDYSWCVANFHDCRLTIFVESPEQASRLRFQQVLLLKKAQSIQANIENISIKVGYKGKGHVEAENRGRTLSTAAAESIVDAAQHITDETLKTALIRLSQRGKN